MKVQKGVSIHRQPGRPNWFCSYRLYDGQTGKWRWVFRSCKTSDETKAREICRAWHKAALKAGRGELSEDAARAIIGQGVSDIFLHATGEALDRVTIRAWCERWLVSKALEASEGTHLRYARVVERFLAFIAKRANRDLSMLSAGDMLGFRDHELKERSRGTANLSVKVLRVCLGEAVRQGLLGRNVAQRVKIVSASSGSKRRDFTLSEIKRILRACGDDLEWRGLVLLGLYTGQRLGDLARLTWRSVNLERCEIAFTTRKTGRRVVLPLVQPLIDYLSSLPANDDPNAYTFPRSAAHKRVARLSNQFRDILVDAGLVEPRSYKTTTKGRSHKRESSEISFHSLRHSAVTLLKASGLSDVFAREIVGHESAAVSRAYTHLSTDDLRGAMARVPGVHAGCLPRKTSDESFAHRSCPAQRG
jgi:integrase